MSLGAGNGRLGAPREERHLAQTGGSLGVVQVGPAGLLLARGRESVGEARAFCLPAFCVLQACLYTVFFRDFSPQSKRHSCQLITVKIVGKMTLEEKVLRKNSYSPPPTPAIIWLCIWEESRARRTGFEWWPPGHCMTSAKSLHLLDPGFLTYKTGSRHGNGSFLMCSSRLVCLAHLLT